MPCTTAATAVMHSTDMCYGLCFILHVVSMLCILRLLQLFFCIICIQGLWSLAHSIIAQDPRLWQAQKDHFIPFPLFISFYDTPFHFMTFHFIPFHSILFHFIPTTLVHLPAPPICHPRPPWFHPALVQNKKH